MVAVISVLIMVEIRVLFVAVLEAMVTLDEVVATDEEDDVVDPIIHNKTHRNRHPYI